MCAQCVVGKLLIAYWRTERPLQGRQFGTLSCHCLESNSVLQ